METQQTERPKPRPVFEYDPNIYKHGIFIDIGYDPDKRASDAIFSHNPEYQDFKLRELPRERAEKYRHVIEDIGIWDYFLFHRDNKIDIHFRHEDERFAVKAALMPHVPQESRFINCERGTSNRALRHMRKELKEMFAQTQTGTRAKFLIDRKNKQIRVRTSNGPDFIQFLKDSAEMRGTIFPIPKPAAPQTECKDGFAHANTPAARMARLIVSPVWAFDAAALPPEMGFDVTHPRRAMRLPETRRLPVEERTRRDYHHYYQMPPKPEKAAGPS